MRRVFCLLLAIVPFLSECTPQPTADFAIYLPASQMTVSEMASVDLQKLPLQDTPVFATADIVTYSWGTHEIKLTAAAFDRIMAMKIPMRGMPFVACVDRKPVYWGAFWTPFSSMSFEGITIIPMLGADSRTIQITLGYPSSGFFQGDDPRPNADVRRALERAGKLK